MLFVYIFGACIFAIRGSLLEVIGTLAPGSLTIYSAIMMILMLRC
jgi:hypothetical protein